MAIFLCRWQDEPVVYPAPVAWTLDVAQRCEAQSPMAIRDIDAIAWVHMFAVHHLCTHQQVQGRLEELRRAVMAMDAMRSM